MTVTQAPADDEGDQAGNVESEGKRKGKVNEKSICPDSHMLGFLTTQVRYNVINTSDLRSRSALAEIGNGFNRKY